MNQKNFERLKRQREYQRKYRETTNYKKRIARLYKSKEYHEYHRNYYIKNRERILIAHKTPRVKARQLLYRKRPEVKIRDYLNKQKPIRKAWERWYNKTPEQKERIKKWFKTPAGIANRRNLEYRRRGAGERFTTELYLKVWKKTPNTCKYCKSKLTPETRTIDHYIPLLPRSGEPKGTNEFRNLWPACRSCNFSKSNRSAKLFLKLLRQRQTLSSSQKQYESKYQIV